MSSSSPRARRRSPRPAPSTGRPAAKANVPGGPGPPGTSARCTASPPAGRGHLPVVAARLGPGGDQQDEIDNGRRSEEHTSELQSPVDLVCRLLLEKKERCRFMVSSRAVNGQLEADREDAWHLPLSLEEGFFFNDTTTTEIYTLSLHDALPI